MASTERAAWTITLFETAKMEEPWNRLSPGSTESSYPSKCRLGMLFVCFDSHFTRNQETRCGPEWRFFFVFFLNKQKKKHVNRFFKGEK